jgi:hypothetical protein
MLHIPSQPSTLSFRVDRLWDGNPCPDDRLWAELQLSKGKDGIKVSVQAPRLHEQSVPDVPMGSRVDKLWEHDVVELFLVGPGHEYVELELGAGGHFLVLGFSSIRKRVNDFTDFKPIVRFEHTSEKIWASNIVLPWKMIPENLRAINVFAIMAGQFMAYAPVPGIEPDFHQPDYYPVVSL